MEFKNARPIVVWRGCNVFGDTIMVAHLVSILRANGYNAIFQDTPPFIDILKVPRGGTGDHFEAAYEALDRKENIINGMLGKFARQFGVPKPELIKGPPPVAIEDRPNVPKVDIAICSQCGFWSEIREWPHFALLKNSLTSRGISWIDINDYIKDIKDRRESAMVAGNIICNAKLYLGLETGMSHFAAGLVKPGQGLIIQTGYALPEYWTEQYGDILTIIQNRQQCAPCYLRKRENCQRQHVCSSGISIDIVLDAIMSRMAPE